MQETATLRALQEEREELEANLASLSATTTAVAHELSAMLLTRAIAR